MRTNRFALALFLASLAAAFLPANAQVLPLPAHGGASISLSTSGFIFDVSKPSATAVQVRASSTPLAPSFVASAVLFNHTTAGIDFEFPSLMSAKDHFVFEIFDDNDNLLWRSSPAVPAAGAVVTPGIFPATLAAKSAWRETQIIPLVISGQPLAEGTYRLEAAIDGTPVFNASATFKVTTGALPPPSGVKGVVLAGPVTPVARPGVPNEKPVPGAIIQYFNELSANAVVMTVIADAQGRFQFSAPPGIYSVSATIPGDENTGFGHGTQTVTVTAGHVTEVTFHLDTGIR